MSGEPSRRDTSGFTLIEVLIAMVILSVGLLSLEALGMGAARLVARADRQSEHVARATTRMETAQRELRRSGAVSAATQQPVTFADGAVMTTRISQRSVDGNPADNELFEIAVKVTPRATDRTLSARDTLSLRTNVFIP